MRSPFSPWRFGRSGGTARPLEHELRRLRMVERQIRRRGISDEGVLAAMSEVPRHLFVPPDHREAAYEDHALPIGEAQTISQPYIVAFMTSALRPAPGLRVLEIGTGSGYQAAVLAACGMDVFTVERILRLHEPARENLETAGYADRVSLALDDGSHGWPDPEVEPFDRILVTAAAPDVPTGLRNQLVSGGILVAPIGDPYLQTICRYTKEPDDSLLRESLEGARFVPLVRGREE